MANTTLAMPKPTTNANPKMATYLGELKAFTVGLKLYHWHVTGKGSYSEHIALDQLLEQLDDPIDRIVETAYALYGTLDISVDSIKRPADIKIYCNNMHNTVKKAYDLFTDSFQTSINDDIAEAIQQCLFRLNRLW